MMKRERLIILIIALIAIQPFTMIGTTPQSKNPQALQSLTIDSFQPSTTFTIDGAGGEEEIKSVINDNGGFEEANPYNIPTGYNPYTTTWSNINSTYQDLVHAGSYAYQVRAKGTGSAGGSAQGYRQLETSPRPDLEQHIYLNSWYYGVSNPDSAFGGYLQFRVRVTSGASNWYLNYVLSAGTMPSNTSNSKYLDCRASLGSWHNLYRNITKDFEDVFQPVQSYHRAYYVYARTYSPVGATGYAEMVIDDVRVYNGTSYEFCTPNGDFEGTGGGWYNYNQGPGFVQQTTDHTEGNYAVNLTAYAPNSGVDPYAQLDFTSGQGGSPVIGYYASSPENLVYECDWKYTDIPGGGSNQYAYLRLDAENGTHSANIYIYFGVQGDIILNTNYTDATYIRRVYAANGFGTRDTWHHLEFDPYETLAEVGFTNMAFDYQYFDVRSGGIVGNKVSLLIDNLKIISYPTGDPGFEEDWYWVTSNPIVSWDGDSSHTTINITDDAHSGDHAARVSISSGSDCLERDMWLPVNSTLYTDFWWKLDPINKNQVSAAYIQITMEGGYYLYYILGASEYYTPTNSSNSVYYSNVDNYNQTGSWYNLVRNLENDAVAAWGEQKWNITNIYLWSMASAANPTTVLYDDINFVYDTTGPEITDVELWNTPNYNQNGIILVTTTDAICEVDDVLVYYRNDSTWYYESAPLYSGEDTYRAILPQGDYDTFYEYYVVVNDTHGFTSIDDNTGSYYSFTIDDLINPDITITSPSDSDTISGTVEVTVDCDDRDVEGSGIDYVEYLDGMTVITTVDTAPYSFYWDTRTVANGAHTLNARAYDNAGNEWLDSISVTTDNDFDAPALSNFHIVPETPVAGSPVEVRIEVTDASSLDYVSLFYRVDSGTWTELSMSLTGGNYSATIPAVYAPGFVEYYIQTADEYLQVSNYGTAVSPYSYEFEEEPTPTTTNAGTLSIGIIGIIGTIFITLKMNKRRK